MDTELHQLQMKISRSDEKAFSLLKSNDSQATRFSFQNIRRGEWRGAFWRQLLMAAADASTDPSKPDNKTHLKSEIAICEVITVT